MAEFVEDFEGAANGTVADTTTTSFTGANTGVEGTHSTLQAISGTKSFRILNPAATLGLYMALTPNRTVNYTRVYFQSVTLATSVIMAVMSAGTQLGNVQVTSGGVIRLRDGATTVATATTSLTAGQWYRFEHFTDLAAGTQTLRIFFGANLHGTTPDETITGAVTTGSFNRIQIGTFAAQTTEVFYDAFAADPNGWVGPYSAGAAGGFIVREDGTSKILLENGADALVTEDYVAPSPSTIDPTNFFLVL